MTAILSKAKGKFSFTNIQYRLFAALVLFFTLGIGLGSTAQTPIVTYESPQVYAAGQGITPLEPTAENVGAAGYATKTLLVSTNNYFIYDPVSIMAGHDGYVYLGGSSLSRFRASDGGTPHQYGTFSYASSSGGMCMDAQGRVYTTNKAGQVYRVSLDGNSISGYGSFSSAWDVGVDERGYIYVADADYGIYRLNPNGQGQVGLLAVTGIQHIAVDKAGNVYYLQSNSIKKLVAGTVSPVNYVTNVVLTGASSLDIDAAGNLYFANVTDVYKVLATNQGVTSIADGFDDSKGVAVDHMGRVFATNIGAVSSGDAIYRILPTGGFHAYNLPAGLNINENTGIISGEPANSSFAKDYQISAYNGAASTTSIVNIAVTSEDANLSQLYTNYQYPLPGFDPEVLEYRDTLNANASSITVTPTASDPTATITVNSIPVTSGNASAPVELVAGENVIYIDVTASAGNTKNYSMIITRLPSTNAELDSLIIEDHQRITLDPVFSPGTTDYTATTNGPVEYVYVTPGSDPTQAVYVNDEYVGCGCSSSEVEVFTGPNEITVKVIAEDGVTEKNYKITVNVPVNTNLESLDIDESVDFDPPFHPDSTTYAITVRGTKSSLVVYPAAADISSIITVNDVEVASGDASEEIPLVLGQNEITVKVTAADNSSSKTYTLNINRNGTTEAGLDTMTVSDGVLDPVFATADTAYHMNVGAAVEYIGVTPTAIDSNATIYVDGFLVPSGEEGFSDYLYEGENTVYVDVVASDGVTTKTYVITVDRLPPVYPGIDYIPSVFSFTTGQPITPVVPVTSDVDPITAGYNTPTVISDELGSINNIVLDEDENIYVATQGSDGGLFKISNCCGTPELINDDYKEIFGLAINSAGDLFMSDVTQSTIFKIAAGTTTPVAIGSGFNQPAGLALDTAGNIYVANSGNGVISKLLASDNYSTVEQIAEGFTQPTGLAIDGNKNIYIAETTSGKLTKLLAADNYQTADTLATGLLFPIGVKADAVGNIFLTEAGNQRIIKFPAGGAAPDSVLTGYPAVGIDFTVDGRLYFNTISGEIAVTAPLGGYYIDKPLPSGLSFNDTTGVISGTPLVESPNKKYFVTANNAVGASYEDIDIEVAAGNALLDSLILGSGTVNPAFTSSRLNYTSIVDSAVTVLNVTPYLNDVAATIKVNGDDVVSGSPSQDVPLDYGDNTINIVVTSANGLATKNYRVVVNRGAAPPAISYGTGSQVYVTNTPITPLTLTGGSTVNLPGYNCLPDSLTNAISMPFSLTADGQGNLYSVNNDDGLIYKINAATGETDLYSADFPDVYGIAADYAGNLFVTDPNAAKVSKIPAGGGTPVVVSTALEYPVAVAVDNGDNLYVLDGATGDLVRINAGTNDTTLIGPGFSSVISIAVDGSRNIYVGSGHGKVVKLLVADNYNSEVILADDMGIPFGLAVDPAGNVFVTDAIFGTLEKITSSGEISTISECMLAPAGVTVGTNGKLFVADAAYGEIDYFNPKGGYHLDRQLPGGLTFNDTTGTISGTPTLVTPARDYTVTAYNQFGAGQTTLNIRVVSDVFNADLSRLVVSGGTLIPVFNSAKVTYRSTLLTETVRLRPTAADPGATITVNGDPVVSGVLSAEIPINIGANPIPVVVTAADGYNTKTYTVRVGRGSSESRLEKMIINPTAKLEATGTTGSVINYTASVEAGSTRITLKPFARDKNATIVVNGNPVADGTSTGVINLEPVGPTIISMVITAQDGVTVSTYSITVIKEGSNNAYLKLITLNPASTLVKTTGPGDVNYVTSVDANVTRVTVKPTAEDKNATITVNGETVRSGSISSYITLEAGPTVINIHVIAQNGMAEMDYTVTVNRTGSNNAKLKTIAITPSGTLVPITATSTINYTTSVDASTTQVKIRPTAENKFASILVNGIPVATGTNSGLIDLELDGSTVINIMVTAQDGVTTQGYTVTVQRNGSNNANLKTLTLNPNVTITEVSATSYSATVDASVSTVRVKPTPEESHATMTVSGTPVAIGTSTPVNVTEGENIIPIEITAQDGTTIKTYTLTVTRSSMTPFSVRSGSAPEDINKPKGEVTVGKALSPNADGMNDHLEITGIEAYPENSLAIMNSKGVQVRLISGYDNQANAFDGRNNAGAMQPSGIYFYLLEYKQGNETKRKSGYVVMKY